MTIREAYLQACVVISDIYEHLPTLNRYADECETIVELGVNKGNSTKAFLFSEAKKIRSYDIKLTPEAIDLALMAQKEGKDFILEAADDLKIKIPECDLLFIDTIHTEDHVREELRLHSNKAKKYILLHDTSFWGLIGEDTNMNSRGILFALIPFLNEHPEWVIKDHIVKNNGLTILERRKENV